MSENNQQIETDDLDITKDKVIVGNNAQTIYDNIKSLENEPKHRKRWIWELLQNAEDTAEDFPVNVDISFDGNTVIFSHNGPAFTKDDITHLIFHGSSKFEMEDKRGKFGTGFMTTHLLSKQVRIQGSLKDGRSFDFILDRRANSRKEMTAALSGSWDRFKASLKNSEGLLITTFTYLDIAEEHIIAVGEVLSKIDLLIPPVLAFSDNIGAVHIVYNDSDDIYQKEQLAENIIKIIAIKKGSDESLNFYIMLHILNDEKTKIALFVDNEGSILELDKRIPRLFITFPIIGSEQAFPLPFLINSPEFVPSPERDKIWLSATETTDTQTNKSILSNVFKEYIEFVCKNLKDQRKNEHLLADMGALPEIEWVDRSWYQTEVGSIIGGSMNCRLLHQ